MTVLIKRYANRKLYNTETSRYITLKGIAELIEADEEVRVIDNDTSEDVTAQTLTQVILEEGRRGSSLPSSEVLHELIRRGGKLVSYGVEQLHQGVDRLLQAGMDRLAPVRAVREEASVLRTRLEELEASIARMELNVEPAPGSPGRRPHEQDEARDVQEGDGDGERKEGG